jgi:putative membrane protein
VTNALVSWLILSVSVWLTAAILPGFEVRGFKGAVIVAAIFGLLSWLLGWLLFVFFGLATFGIGFIFRFVTRWLVMTVLIKLTDSISDNLTIKDFGTAAIGALIMSGLGTFGEYLLRGIH